MFLAFIDGGKYVKMVIKKEMFNYAFFGLHVVLQFDDSLPRISKPWIYMSELLHTYLHVYRYYFRYQISHKPSRDWTSKFTLWNMSIKSAWSDLNWESSCFLQPFIVSQMPVTVIWKDEDTTEDTACSEQTGFVKRIFIEKVWQFLPALMIYSFSFGSATLCKLVTFLFICRH